MRLDDSIFLPRFLLAWMFDYKMDKGVRSIPINVSFFCQSTNQGTHISLLNENPFLVRGSVCLYDRFNHELLSWIPGLLLERSIL